MNHTEPDAKSNDVHLLSAEKVASLLDISVRTLWRLRSAGQLPEPVRLGGSIRWNANELRDWVEAGCPMPKQSSPKRRT